MCESSGCGFYDGTRVCLIGVSGEASSGAAMQTIMMMS